MTKIAINEINRKNVFFRDSLNIGNLSSTTKHLHAELIAHRINFGLLPGKKP